MAEAQIAALAGRQPDGLFGDYSPFGIGLPSGTVLPAPAGANARPDGFDTVVWQQAALFWPGGLANIDPARVVSVLPVQPYQVLPSQMGLAQLVGRGDARFLGEDRFLIVRDIARIPPGMYGAHSAVLVLADGVKRPPGHAGHGCVVTEAEAAQAPKPGICNLLDRLPSPPPPIRAQ